MKSVMIVKPFSYTFWLTLLFVVLGYLCDLQANYILLNNLSIDTYGDFSCAWRILNLFAQIMLVGSSYTRYHYDKRTISPKFYFSHRPLIMRSFAVAVTIYSIFWLFTLHAHRANVSLLSSYHLVYFASIFAILQACVILLERFTATLGFTLYARFSSDFLHYLIKLLVIAVGFQLYQPILTPELTAFIATFLILMALCDVLSIKILTGNYAALSHSNSSQKAGNNHCTYALTWSNLREDPAVATVVGTMTSYAPVYLIEIFSPYEHLVGLYSLCMILISFIRPLLSRISESTHNSLLDVPVYKNKRQKKQLENHFSNIAAIRLFLLLGTYFLYYFFYDQIFSAFSISDFNDNTLVALLLGVVFLENVANQRETFLYSHNQTPLCLWVNCLTLCLMIFLGIYLIDPFSLIGVVVASITSQLVRVTILSFAYTKRCDLRLSLLW